MKFYLVSSMKIVVMLVAMDATVGLPASGQQVVSPSDQPAGSSQVEKVADSDDFVSEERADAERELQRCLGRYGERHSETASALFLLGDVCYVESDYPAAIDYLKRAAAAYRSVFGQDNVDVAASLNNLGLALDQDLQHEAALDYFLQALATYERVVGRDHVDAVNTIHNLGVVYTNLSDFENAKRYFEEALKQREEAFGNESDEALETRQEMGNLAKSMGDYQNARELYDEVLKKRLAKYGESDALTGHSFYAIGELLFAEKNFADSMSNYERALKVYQRSLGAKCNETAITLQAIGDCLRGLSRAEEAKQRVGEALAICIELYGEQDFLTASCIKSMGVCHREMSEFTEAEKQLTRALEILIGLYGEQDVDVAATMSELATLARLQSQLETAQTFVLKGLAIYRERLGNDAIEVANSLTELGSIEFELDERDAAKQHYDEALKIYEAAGEPYRYEFAYTLNRLGSLMLYSFEDFDAALDCHQRALEIMTMLFGQQDIDVASTLHDLGLVAFSLDDYPAAVMHLNRAIEIYGKVIGEDSLDRGRTLSTLGQVVSAMGDYAGGRAHLEAALKIFRAQPEPSVTDVANVMQQLGYLSTRLGKFDEAEAQLKESLQLYTDHFAADNTYIAGPLQSLGDLNRARKRYAEARSYCERALRLYQTRLGNENSNVARLLIELALICTMEKNFQQAMTYVEEARRIGEKAFGREHSLVSDALGCRAEVLKGTGKLADAAACLQEEGAILRQLFGDESIHVARNLMNSAEIDVMAQNDRAGQRIEQARRIVRRYLASVLPTLSSAEQLQFLEESESEAFAKALSFALRQVESKRTVIQSLGWVVNGKAIGQEALAEGALLSRPETAGDVRRLRTVRAKLAQLSAVAANAAEEQARREKIAVLESEQTELQRRIAAAGTGMSDRDPWVSPGQLRDSIPSGSVMVQIAQFKPFGFRPLAEIDDEQSNWGNPIYVAWIVPAAGEGDVVIVPLGEAAAIDRLSQDVLFEMALHDPDISREEQLAAMGRLLPLMKRLAAKILDPLLPHLDDADELIISPDAGLWLIPWGALPIERDFLIDRMNVRYVVSGREMVSRQAMRVGVTAPVVMADPDYNFSNVQVAQQDVERPQRAATTAMLAMRSIDGLDDVQRLQGTAVEAQLIAPELKRLTRSDPQVFMEQHATEAQVKAAYRPRYLVLSTHGFFLEDAHSSTDEMIGRPVSNRSGSRGGGSVNMMSNPLLRCGLLFAGCNQRESVINDSNEDGILTGLEVVGIDLRGTELVVLSACDTGRGDVKCGEGVAGLRQAFQFAGAEAVAASLWKIPDEATVPLMQAFFRNLNDGKSKAAALCDAQRAMIEHRRNTLGTAHPFFWAAFTLTGR